VADAVSSFLNGEEYLAKLRETVREEVEKHEKEAPVPAPFAAPETAPSVVSEVLDIKSPAFTYAIFCDSCDGNIYDVHYHCGICDKGDYDLCQACVGRGTHCKDSSHWLIKRTLTGGTIVSSVTESIKAKAPEPAVEEKEEEPELTRTCNCCIVGMYINYIPVLINAYSSMQFFLKGSLSAVFSAPITTFALIVTLLASMDTTLATSSFPPHPRPSLVPMKPVFWPLEGISATLLAVMAVMV
jgi:hypothetical protein